jgi:hypothetical protein
MKIEDAEPEASGERLELLALVRGLEALPQPARVTLVSESPRLNRMLNGGLEEWRTNDWRWEHHGEMVPVKNADLWRRVDRALHFHEVRLRTPPAGAEAKSKVAMRHSSAEVGEFRHNGTSPAAHFEGAQPTLTPQSTRCRKSLARKVLQSSAVVRRRFRQCCRRWIQAMESLAADDNAYTWAD